MQLARILASVGLSFLTILFFLLLAVTADRSLNPGIGLAVDAAGWGEAFDALDEVEGVADYQDVSYEGVQSSHEAEPEELADWAKDNGFVASSALLLAIGFLGYGLMATALARRKSDRLILIAFGGVAGMTFGGFLLLGFDLAYPVETWAMDLLPRYGGPWFGALEEDDAMAYGMGFSIWTDVLYQGLYAVTVAVLVMGLGAGSLRLWTVVPAACAVSLFGFPLVVSWHWGGGVLSGMNAYDFAGSAMIHTLAGGAGLGLLGAARMFPPSSPMNGNLYAPVKRPPPTEALGPGRTLLFVLGLLLFLTLVVGVQGGSVLSLDAPLVAAVLLATLAACGGGVLGAGVVSIFLALRARLVVMSLGGLAGWAAVCGPADLITASEALVLGLISGGVCGAVLWLLDRFGWDDPLGLVPVSLFGGAIGLLAAAVFGEEVPIFSQILLAGLTGVVGLTLGGCAGLFGWLGGVLWSGEEVKTPEVEAGGEPGGAMPL